MNSTPFPKAILDRLEQTSFEDRHSIVHLPHLAIVPLHVFVDVATMSPAASATAKKTRNGR